MNGVRYCSTTRYKYVLQRFILAIVCLFIVVKNSEAQTRSVSITVKRQDTNAPLSDALIRMMTLNTSSKHSPAPNFTDKNGLYAFEYTEPVVLQVVHLGFVTITDTLLVPEDRVYSIMLASQSIDDVVITGQYGITSVQKSVYEVKVVNSETLRNKGANNLREALMNELNIDIGQDQVFGSSLSINGISGEGIKILIDGVPVVGRLDGKLDLSQINLQNIERIEIVEGPLSVVYGTDAMGGVINIITKTFQKEKVNLNLKGYYESVGQYNIELNTGFSFKKNQIYLTGGRNFFDGFTTLDSLPRFQEWKPKEQYFADAKYMYTGNRLKFTIGGSFFRELMLDRSAPKKTLAFGESDTAWTYTGDDIHYLTYRPRASMSFSYRFKDDYQFDILASYSGFMRYVNRYAKDLVSQNESLVNDASAHDTSFYHQALVRATYTMPAWKRRIHFQFGIEANNEFTKQTRIQGGRKQLGDYGAFGSVRFTIAKGLDIQPAIRIIYNTRFRAPLVPSLNVKYNIKEKVVLRASYGMGYRAPSLKELYMTFFDINHSLIGNENLTAEKGHILNASINYSQAVKEVHKVNFSVSGFYNHINDKIDWKIIPSPGPAVDTYQYYNVKKYITYGGEVSLGYQWKEFRINASGMLTAYQLNNGLNTVKMLSPDFTVTASYSIPKALIGVNVTYKYNGQKPLFSINNSIQAGRRLAYNMLDISFTRNFWKDRIQLTVGGKNLVGVTNVVAEGVSAVGHSFSGNTVNIAWGRTFFTSLVLHFSR